LPVADEIRQFTSSTFAVFHALDELRQKYGMKLGQIVPVTQKEIAEIADLTQQRTGELTEALEKDGWLTYEPRRGYIQNKPLPLKAVRQ
jgi:DNA-binding MarR family transcriptional regulator